MKVMVAGRQHDLSRAPLLGEGGEAKVFRVGDRALKIFHPCPAGLTKVQQATATRVLVEKARKVAAFPSVPPQVVAPLSPVTTPNGDFVGYAMALHHGASDAADLLRPQRRPVTFGLESARRLLLNLHSLIVDVHAANIVIGDLNAGNILVVGETPFLIDADSFQIIEPNGDVLRCVVGHEKFLDPRLFGADLVGKAAPVVFSAHSDWYAFAVFAFQLLTLIHPYGGVVSNIPTLLRRAEARHSALRADVRLPRVALPFDRLPTSLIAAFSAIFDADERKPFERCLLEQAYIRCACGAEHARPKCPQCNTTSTTSPSAAHPRTRNHKVVSGRCTEVEILTTATAGHIVETTVFGGIRALVATPDGAGAFSIADDRGAAVTTTTEPNALLSAARQVFTTAGGFVRPLTNAEVEPFTVDDDPNGLPAVVGSGAHIFGATSGVLWDRTRNVTVGRTLEGRTQLFGGGQKVAGTYRLGRSVVVVVHRVGTDHVADIVLPTPEGRLVESAVAFDPAPTGPLLLTEVWERNGKVSSRCTLLDPQAQVLAQQTFDLDDGEWGAVSTGRCVFQHTVLIATDNGLAAFKPTPSGGLEIARQFTSTQSAVDPSVALFPDGGGGLYVVRPQSISQLTLG